MSPKSVLAIAALALTLAVSGACLDRHAVRCPSGIVCAPGQTCDEVHGGCVQPDQLFCTGAQEPCSYPGVTDGRCFDGVCLPAGCGNGVVDLVDGERCDDHNQLAGDGCSPDCQSDETCGNRVLDTSVGEQCDEGPEGGNGCSVTCVLGTCGDGTWEVGSLEQCDLGAANSATTPDACRPGCRVPWCGDSVTDPGRGEVCDDGNPNGGDGCRPDCLSDERCGNGITDVLAGELCDDGAHSSFDGCGSTCRLETAAWQVAPGNGRKGDSRSWAMTYDVTRRRLFGIGSYHSPGQFAGNDPILAERRRRDWQVLPWDTVGPVMRSGSAVAWSPTGILLFGGRAGDVSDDTWIWDGVAWSRRTPPTAPPSRHGHAMARDAARDRIVLFGGSGDLGPMPLGDTWEWDGTTWTLRATTGPAARYQAALAYDPVRGRVVSFGGTTDGISSFGDTWEWDGTSWSQRFPSAPPNAAIGASMTWDAVRQKVVMVSDATYQWDGTSWTIVTSVVPPGAGRVVAYADDLGRVISDAGLGNSWELDGNTWIEIDTPGAIPSPRATTASGLDTEHGELVMFGGDGIDGGVFGDTWTWNGLAWHDQLIVVPPSARRGHAMASAPNGKVVMIGGRDDLGTVLGDTWEWTAVDWIPHTDAPSPSPREDAAMAFDGKRSRTVLFGGSDGNASLDDTWEWTGTGWIDRSPALSPSPRSDAALAYDPLRERIVMFGGSGLADTWEWDGVTWSERSPLVSPPPGVDDRLAYVPARRRVVLLRDPAWEWDGATWTSLPVAGVATPEAVLDYLPSAAAVVGLDGVYDPDDKTWTPSTVDYAHRAGVLEDTCDGAFDVDGDGLAGCADPDCWWRCTPRCPPGTSCDPSLPRCGDTTCSALEDCWLCPGDCGACPARCGDDRCVPGESLASCPGDCTP